MNNYDDNYDNHYDNNYDSNGDDDYSYDNAFGDYSRRRDHRAGLYDQFAEQDDGLRPAGLGLTRPSTAEWARATMRQNRAMPAIAVGLSAVLGIGALLAVANSASGSAPAGQAIEGVPPTAEPAVTPAASSTIAPSPGDVTALPNRYQRATLPNRYDLSTMPTPTPTPTPAPTPPTTVTTPPTTITPPPTTTTTTPPTTSTTTTTTTAPPPPGGNEPVLFWNDQYVGYWEGSTFVPQRSQDISPDWLVGTPLVLQNQANQVRHASAVWCEMAVALSPTGGYANTANSYWFAGDAPFIVGETNESDTTAAMEDALQAMGLDPARAGSYGAPLAADGSADRLLWYFDANGYISWFATFDVETASFRTVEGDPDTELGFEVGEPVPVWVDLDRDGNLESVYGSGDGFTLMEWATGDDIWAAGPSQCN